LLAYASVAVAANGHPMGSPLTWAGFRKDELAL